MDIQQVKGSVIWRLPEQEQVCILEDSGGDDQFMIAPFNRHDDIKTLKGTIKNIDLHEIESFFSGWALPEAVDMDSTSRDDYISWVEKAKQSMSDGVFDKVVLARKLWKPATTDIPRFFKKLIDSHPNALVYAFRLDDGTVMIGATPETLLRKNSGIIYTEALGGTLTRGVYTEKEKIEHGHISEYVGNILGEKGYSFKRSEISTRRAGMVEHLLTPFTASSLGDEQDMALAYALHPTAAVCGMPFREAFGFIRQTEDFDRKYYSGFLGPVQKQGDFSLFVNLRCAEVFSNGLLLYAGAGLNVFSDPSDEWDETARKMQTVAQIL